MGGSRDAQDKTSLVKVAPHRQAAQLSRAMPSWLPETDTPLATPPESAHTPTMSMRLGEANLQMSPFPTPIASPSAPSGAQRIGRRMVSVDSYDDPVDTVHVIDCDDGRKVIM
jgi:hypothetical protein